MTSVINKNAKTWTENKVKVITTIFMKINSIYNYDAKNSFHHYNQNKPKKTNKNVFDHMHNNYCVLISRISEKVLKGWFYPNFNITGWLRKNLSVNCSVKWNIKKWIKKKITKNRFPNDHGDQKLLWVETLGRNNYAIDYLKA